MMQRVTQPSRVSQALWPGPEISPDVCLTLGGHQASQLPPCLLLMLRARPLKSLLTPSAPQLDLGGKETLALLRPKISLLEGSGPCCSSQPLIFCLYKPSLPRPAYPSCSSRPVILPCQIHLFKQGLSPAQDPSMTPPSKLCRLSYLQLDSPSQVGWHPVPDTANLNSLHPAGVFLQPTVPSPHPLSILQSPA